VQGQALGWAELAEPSWREPLTDFDWALRWVDFSGVRPVWAQGLDWTSARGGPLFDPVSLFLLHGWQLSHGWSRSETLRRRRDPRSAAYARRFGFPPGVYPTEGGLRYFLTALGQPCQEQDLAILLPADDGQEPQPVALHRLTYLLAQTGT
jgi:hypothetical protein